MLAVTLTFCSGCPVAALVITPLIEPPVSSVKFRSVIAAPAETDTGAPVARAFAAEQKTMHGMLS